MDAQTAMEPGREPQPTSLEWRTGARLAANLLPHLGTTYEVRSSIRENISRQLSATNPGTQFYLQNQEIDFQTHTMGLIEGTDRRGVDYHAVLGRVENSGHLEPQDARDLALLYSGVTAAMRELAQSTALRVETYTLAVTALSLSPILESIPAMKTLVEKNRKVIERELSKPELNASVAGQLATTQAKLNEYRDLYSSAIRDKSTLSSENTRLKGELDKRPTDQDIVAAEERGKEQGEQRAQVALKERDGRITSLEQSNTLLREAAATVAGSGRESDQQTIAKLTQQVTGLQQKVTETESDRNRIRSSAASAVDASRGYEEGYEKLVMEGRSQDIAEIVRLKAELQTAQDLLQQKPSPVESGGGFDPTMLATVSEFAANYASLEGLQPDVAALVQRLRDDQTARVEQGIRESVASGGRVKKSRPKKGGSKSSAEQGEPPPSTGGGAFDPDALQI